MISLSPRVVVPNIGGNALVSTPLSQTIIFVDESPVIPEMTMSPARTKCFEAPEGCSIERRSVWQAASVDCSRAVCMAKQIVIANQRNLRILSRETAERVEVVSRKLVFNRCIV